MLIFESFQICLRLIVKWWWRAKTEHKSLWCKVITCIHNLHNKPHDQIANKHLNGVWNNITSVRKDLIKHGMDVDDIFKLHVKSRGNTKFWYDKQITEVPLKDKYPSLFNLQSRKKCVVTYRFYEGEFVGNWNACLGTAGLAQDLSNLHMDLNLIQL